MCSSQFIFWPAKIFTNFRYDERFRFVYEDLDFSKNITKIGIKIFVPENIKVFHYDKKTNPAKRSYVANPFLAYEKGKNRMLFVKKHFNFWEKLIFYSVGIWIHTLRSLLLIIIRWENKWNSIKAFIKGSIKGLIINKRISINSHLPNNSF
jgi:GT2 family glycosyltransferase